MPLFLLPAPAFPCADLSVKTLHSSSSLLPGQGKDILPLQRSSDGTIWNCGPAKPMAPGKRFSGGTEDHIAMLAPGHLREEDRDRTENGGEGNFPD